MYVLGLQGSPRKNGNTDDLLTFFLNEALKTGAEVEKIDVAALKFLPCLGCAHCEKKGECIHKDKTMVEEIYPKIKRADLIVMATPVFFYALTGQLKLLIDRCQMFWSRKYRFHVNDPSAKIKKGIVLSVAASGGKEVFRGIELCATYFFDAVGAGVAGGLFYRGIENRGDIKSHPQVWVDIEKKVVELVKPLSSRKQILFVDQDHGMKSRMAEAFARFHLGEHIHPTGCGVSPQHHPLDLLETMMAEKKIDMAFYPPLSLDQAIKRNPPDLVVMMGKGVLRPVSLSAFIPSVTWEFQESSEMDHDEFLRLRDEIEKKVLSFSK